MNIALTEATAPAAGSRAPDFSLPCAPDSSIALADLRGKPVVLVFYPADWSPVCGDQLALYNDLGAEFGVFEAQLLGISVDGVWCHAAYREARHLRFPLLSDFEPKGEIAGLYGVYRRGEGCAERALFVIDAEGIIRWSHVVPIAVNPGADGILAALETLPRRPS
jgi:peroxiredoxin